ncbi:Lar family restriction alleviation protein [Blastomonas sp. CCH2-A2]|uniref:Lar family restriction alleviation protein n=1 Tax=Blastomonas sp. CCH2-A2 TaxID=1768788 RepID=UPI000A85C363|nr:Lar family restriction alleviation protein [Blastomonas sp. CCH2-A2]
MTHTQDSAPLKPCPMCGSGPAKGFGRYTNASFSGVEVMDQTNMPYVWCGTCCLQTCTYDSIEEAITAWNTRATLRTDEGDEV